MLREVSGNLYVHHLLTAFQRAGLRLAPADSAVQDADGAAKIDISLMSERPLLTRSHSHAIRDLYC